MANSEPTKYFLHDPVIVKDCNLFKEDVIELDRDWFSKGSTLKFAKSYHSSTIHKIMIERKIKTENNITQYKFTNIYPIFADTIILSGTKVKHVNNKFLSKEEAELKEKVYKDIEKNLKFI